MLVVVWPLIVAVVGLIIYLASANVKSMEIGRILFAVGMFFVLYAMMGKVLRIG